MCLCFRVAVPVSAVLVVAGEGRLCGRLSREPGRLVIPEARVHLQWAGLKDSQGSSRTPWVSLTGTSSHSRGAQHLWAHPGRREMRIISKEMDLEVYFSQLKAKPGIH